ncbi:hypothetical protein [Thiofilum flexile]|uniref:hypothetical protein n=1 Tax=Thiofilum flexile TaxID=125627 RepID=UPI000373BD26|nr:hypothetical protein [Thiofilum flexile]
MTQSIHRLAKSLIINLLVIFPAIGSTASEDPIDAPAFSFFTQYSGDKIIDASISIYDKKNKPKESIGINLTVPLPANIKQALFSPNTQNPFKKAYAVFYNSNNFKQLKTCPFIGINFNIDNNLKTEEWYITTPATGCIKDQPDLSYSNSVTHNWILQQDEKGSFKILMESDDALMIDLATPQSTYKPLDTIHNVMRFMPKSTLGCGDVYIKWRYNNTKKQYQYIFYNPRIAGCDQKFSYEIVTDLGAKKAITAVNKVILPWVKNNLPAFR